MMRWCRAFLCVMLLAISTMPGATASAGASAVGQPPQPPPIEGFEPLSEVPPGEQIPAFTLLASAYAFVWIVLLGYVWSVSRRLQKVEQELARLEGRGA